MPAFTRLRAFLRSLTPLLVLSAPWSGAAAQGPPPEVREAVDAVVRFLDGGAEIDVDAFARDRLTADYRASFTDVEALRHHLATLREAGAGHTGSVSVEAEDDGLRLILEGEIQMLLALAPGTALLSRLELVAVTGDDPGGDVRSVVDGHMRALEDLARSDPAARQAFASDHLDPALVRALGAEELERLLSEVRRLAATASGVTADVAPDGYRLGFRGTGADADVLFNVSDAPPYAITELRLAAPPDRGGADTPPVTWATLEERLDALTEGGFAGVVLAVRDGEPVLHRGFGAARAEAGRPNGTATVFGIGSIPIDFTRAAVLLLVQDGLLSLDDTLADLFPQVPADKRAITVAQLLDGTSGLPNFHHTADDDDRDLTWIDREEAEGRILGMELLFAPGTSRAPSHSAFGLLAAAVERRSGRTYPDFVRERLFGPAGMTRTGFYGDDGGLDPDEFAAGYGGDQVGEHNIPPEWGPTSWLVMGSGGMWSTPADMALWFDAMRSGRILRGDALARYMDRGPALGASDRGFLFVHAWTQGDTSIFLAGNAGTESPDVQAFVRGLLQLVGARPIT